jgi:nucleotide-binding universal stress UspA family protein
MLADRWNESLELVHAIDTPLFADWDAELRARARGDAARRLHDEAERVRQRGTPAIAEFVDEGAADEVLVSKAAIGRARLIVLGALGRSVGPARWIGGTAARVAASAKSPVLVVRAAPPIQAWLREEKPLKVVVGDDLTHVSMAALRWTADLRRLGPCEIVACHVFSLLGEKSRLGIGGPLHARVSELERANLAALRRHAGSSLGSDGVRYRVEGTLGRAAEPLLDIASDEAADLVVVGTGQRTGLNRAWHGWTSQIVLNDAHCSVACVPADATGAEEPDVVPNLRRVLVTTDFTTIGDHAVAYAHAIVAEGGTVHIMHVEKPGEAAENHRRSIERLELIAKNASRKHVETQLEVVSAPSVPAAITAAAERLDVDVVCMGTHGRSGLPGVVVGSVARAVTERCRRQVLLVPPQRPPSP